MPVSHTWYGCCTSGHCQSPFPSFQRNCWKGSVSVSCLFIQMLQEDQEAHESVALKEGYLDTRPSLLNLLRSPWYWLAFYMQVLLLPVSCFQVFLSLFFWGRASPANGESLPWRSLILCKCDLSSLWDCLGSSLLMHRVLQVVNRTGEETTLSPAAQDHFFLYPFHNAVLKRSSN